MIYFVFFFQAEDGIRDTAPPESLETTQSRSRRRGHHRAPGDPGPAAARVASYHLCPYPQTVPELRPDRGPGWAIRQHAGEVPARCLVRIWPVRHHLRVERRFSTSI